VVAGFDRSRIQTAGGETSRTAVRRAEHVGRSATGIALEDDIELIEAIGELRR
jgi:hypothetical protein